MPEDGEKTDFDKSKIQEGKNYDPGDNSGSFMKIS